MLFINGHMIDGVDGVKYDQPAYGGFSINVNNGLIFEQFIEMIGMSLGVNMRANQLEIYKHPNLTPLRSLKYMSFPIPNKQAMNLMFSIAIRSRT